MANEDITAVEAAERVLWGYVAEAQAYCELAGRAELDSLAVGLLSRLCDGVEDFTRELVVARLGGPERSVGRGAQPTCERSATDPALSLPELSKSSLSASHVDGAAMPMAAA